MGKRGFVLVASFLLLSLFLPPPCIASTQTIGKIHPGFEGSQMNWIDKDGFFLLSNNSTYGLGFNALPHDVTSFLLVVAHMASRQVIWSANRGSPVANSDKFVFSDDGNVSLQKGSSSVWTTNTGGKGASAIELQDSGNLVLLGNDSKVIWESFQHPTDTLISNQEFAGGMRLVSDPSSNNLTYTLEMKSGDMILSAGFPTPQPYWSMKNDKRMTINKAGGQATMASISSNSWRFYDANNVLLWQFRFSDDTSPNITFAAVLGNDGFISFYNLNGGGTNGGDSTTKVPPDGCSTPEPCGGAYYICGDGNRCTCPAVLNSPNCNTGIVDSCNGSKGPMDLASVGDGLSYFAVGFVSPFSTTDLEGCKSSCHSNCSCLAMVFKNSSGNCFLFDDVGGFQSSNNSGFDVFIKVLGGGDGGNNNGGGGGSGNGFPYVIVIIVVATLLVICSMLYVAYRYYKRKRQPPASPQESSGEDNFLESLSGMPVRFSYRELQTAANGFSTKLGQGGFGSVYQGTLPDGTRLAVKKLEGIGQGKKEFRAEVSIIGSIHHHHLVRLKGFCAEGTHRLLAYEFMANGSLDKWIFSKNREEFILDWETRFNIALGTAKGLAYLHEDCDVKIIHCDIKPENVLLDDHFVAKVSDFGLAKLMTREQSHVFTTLRGTRGYLAPEWITNYAISEKSDVYSYGMLLLEIIAGRKNFNPDECSEKAHFPSYAFKMMEEGKLRELLDANLTLEKEEERVSTSIKVALWCIQEDMHLRPSMTKVVQMLEGLCHVPQPPISSPLGSRPYSGFFKSISSEGTSSGPSGYNSETHQSAVRLSGPR